MRVVAIVRLVLSSLNNKDLSKLDRQFTNAASCMQLLGSWLSMWACESHRCSFVLSDINPTFLYCKRKAQKRKYRQKCLELNTLPAASQRNFYSLLCHALPPSFHILPTFVTAFHWCPLVHRPSPGLVSAGSTPSHWVVWRLLGDPRQNFCLPATNSVIGKFVRAIFIWKSA